jgi:N-acyl-D-amino-acid deacylase
MADVEPRYDLLIRNGLVVDGTGAEARIADVAVTDGVIAAVGPALPGSASEEVDATGLLVTPGFVDIHTHYDGQVTWESSLSPSTDHGVTTIVTGNCGVGFAPCRPDDRVGLVELMAGVEDIPEVVMTEGLSWNWTTFPEYLAAVDARPHDVDIAAMLPHSALRVFVVGERAISRQDATEDDIAQMAELTREAMRAGAIGFGTSRALQQKSIHGEPIPSVRAAEEELRGILGAMAESGTGVFQALSDFDEFEDVPGEFAMFRRLVEGSGRPMSFTLNQKHSIPDLWREQLALVEKAVADGVPIKGQTLARPTGLLQGWDVSVNPFMRCPSYQAIGDLPLDELVEQLSRPEIRKRILEELPPVKPGAWTRRFELTDPPDYEPGPELSIEFRAREAGVDPAEFAYDLLLQDGGRRLIFDAFQNYAEFNLDAAYEMLTHPDTVLGLGDAGAHLGLICDASYPTTMLAYWARDRAKGPRISIEQAVQALTSSTADTVGLSDRGRLAPGYKADINVIDHGALQLRAPQVVRDLPAGGRRIIQRAEGYVATYVAGVATRRDGLPTGALPGQVLRGARPEPAGSR